MLILVVSSLVVGGTDFVFHHRLWRNQWPLAAASALSLFFVVGNGNGLVSCHRHQLQWLHSSTMALVLYLFGCWPIAIKSS